MVGYASRDIRLQSLFNIHIFFYACIVESSGSDFEKIGIRPFFDVMAMLPPAQPHEFPWVAESCLPACMYCSTLGAISLPLDPLT